MTAIDASIADRAPEYAVDADQAAARAAVEVRQLDDSADTLAASELFGRIWRGADGGPVPAEMCHALAHSGNYVAGAFSGGALVGAIAGFLGRSEPGMHLHSHVAAVAPQARGRSIGFALKLHQRAWAAGAGLRFVEWTFDPLVCANAHFNLVKLGVVPVAYRRNFYGRRDDGVNDGSDTDRLVVRWDIAAAETRESCRGRSKPFPEPHGAAVVLREGPAGRPASSVPPDEAAVRLVTVPRDIVALRRRDPQLAREWRAAVRDALEHAWAGHFRARGFTRAGAYVLIREDAPA
jgi:predicted GNAT superfamily acetyltransferase